METNLFQDIKHVYIDSKTGHFHVDAIASNDFMVAYYPDIGMSVESLMLSNLRLAPIQLCGLGHPVSTFGSKIDYFISGADVEISLGAELNYSERLVLLPGLGSINNYPQYQVINQPQNNKHTNSRFIIGCSWIAQKINYPLVCLLAEIVKKAKKPILFRLFAGGAEAVWQGNGFVTFNRDLESILGKENFEIIPGKPYDEYMQLIQSSDICIDSYHFGGCNTVFDSLYLRKLIITFEGDRWYNRIGSQMLRTVGLSELIATNAQEYIKLTVKLINSDKYRAQLEKKLQQADLDSTIFSTQSKKYFKKAIDFLIENHEQLKSENSIKPIFIE